LGNYYHWAEFDAEADFQHYYSQSHPDDDQVVRCAVKRALPAGNELDVVDVGTGPNLIPLFCALPRAARLTAWENAPSNVVWLEAELARNDTRLQWHHSWGVTREAKHVGPARDRRDGGKIDIVDREIRRGYSGFVFLTGIAR
jgi:hypothetical protein